MVDPFKKYRLDRAEFETPQKLEGVSALKQELLQRKREFTVDDLEHYESMDAFREANNGFAPAEVKNYYEKRDNDAFFNRNEEIQQQNRDYERDALVNNAELDTVTGRVTNALVGIGTETLNKWASDFVTAPDTLEATKMLDGIPEEVLNLWMIDKKGERDLTPDEQELLSGTRTYSFTDIVKKALSPSMNTTDSTFKVLEATIGHSRGMSYRERLFTAEKSLKRAQEISDRFENSEFAKLYNERDRVVLTNDIGATYDRHKGHLEEARKAASTGNYDDAVADTMLGVGKMIRDGGKDLLSNPGATFEFITQQLPYLIAGGASKKVLLAINAAYATDIYREKLTAYQEEHGRPPGDEDRASMAIWSGTAMLAEQAGNLTMLKALKGRAGFSKAVTKVLEVTPNRITNAAKSAYTQATVNLAKSMTTEGLTEVYQTAVEESKDNPFDGTASGKSLLTAGLLGAASGGGFASIGSAGMIMTSTGESAVKALDRKQDRPKLRMNTHLVNQYDKEIRNGDRSVDSLLDAEDVRTYNPARAMIIELDRAKSLEGEEQKAAQQNAEKIRDETQNRAAELRKQLEEESAKKGANPIEIRKLTRATREAKEHARRASDGFIGYEMMIETEQRFAKEAQRKQDLETATQPEASEEGTAAADRVIHTMALNRNEYGPSEVLKDLQKLKDSPSLTEKQRVYIGEVEASFQAHDALNNLKKNSKEVSSNVMHGAAGFKGVNEYRRDVGRALESGDTKKAEAEINKLREFAKEHMSKLRAAKKAYELAIETGRPTYIYKDPKTGWVHGEVGKEGTPWGKTPSERRKNRHLQSQLGAFEFIQMKNGKISGEDFIANIDNEVKLINSTGIILSRSVQDAQAQSVSQNAQTTENAQNETQVQPENAQNETQVQPETENTQNETQVEPEAGREADGQAQNVEIPTPKTAEDLMEIPRLVIYRSQTYAGGTRFELRLGNSRFGTGDYKTLDEAREAQKTEQAQLDAEAEIQENLQPDSSQENLQPDFGFDRSVIPAVQPVTQPGFANVEIGQTNESSQGPPEGQPERRGDTTQRKAVSEMTLEEAIRELLVDGLTGLGNRRAFEEALNNWEDPVISIDADSLKWINDNMSPDVGDQLLKAIGTVIARHTEQGEGFHISGDEFYILTKQDTRPIMEAINTDLAKIRLERTLEDGSIIYKQGLEITYEKGRNKAEADTRLKAEKEAKERYGKRAARGEQPAGVSRQSAEVSAESETRGQTERDSSVDKKEVTPFIADTTNKVTPFIADTTAEAQAAPAAQEPDAGGEANNETETNTDTRTDEQAKPEPTQTTEETAQESPLFKKRSASRRSVTVNPLAVRKDFLKVLLDSGENLVTILQRYIEQDITPKQERMFYHFAGFARKANNTLNKIGSKATSPGFEYTNLVRTLGRDVPPNFRAAIIAAAYTAIAERGSKRRNYPGDINAILGRDPKTKPSKEEWDLLGEPLMRQNAFAQRMGQQITSYLGIKRDPSRPREEFGNLQAALGGYAVALMLERGLLIKRESRHPLLNRNQDRGKLISHNLVMFQYNDLELLEIVGASRGTGTVLPKLFGAPEGNREPASKPGSYDARRENTDLAEQEDNQGDEDNTPIGVKNTPAILAKILEKVSNRKQVLNQSLGNKLIQFGQEGIGRLAGVKTASENTMIHEANKESVEASNESTIRDIQSWLDFRESNGDAPFYLTPVVWLQQRVGLAHTIMNPQSSKVHRPLMYPKAWETEIDPAADDKKGRLFKVAVAQGMGFAVDKHNLQSAVAYYESLIADPVIDAGMQAIRKDELNDDDKAAIQAAVDKGGEHLWSFHVLEQMAQFEQGQPFTTNVMIEIDGVTNGPALTNLMFGTIGPWLGMKVGFMGQEAVGKGILNHSQFKSEHNGRDMYETLAHFIQKTLNYRMQNSNDYGVIRDILYFTGSFSDTGGRKLVKTPLTQLKFGSGTERTMETMAEEFISAYYAAIEKSSDNSNYIAQQEIKMRINRLLSKRNQVTDITAVLTNVQVRELKDRYIEQLGDPVEYALNFQFGEFKARRSSVFKVSEAIFEIYMSAHETLVDQALEQGRKDGTLRVNKKGQLTQDLSQEAYEEIDRKLGKMLPFVHTALSRLSNQGDRTKGLFLPKHTTNEDGDNQVYSQQLQFEKKIRNNFVLVKGKHALNDHTRDGETITQWVRLRSRKPGFKEPGVRAVVLAIHSTDSAIAAQTYAKFDALNIHDALGFGINDVVEGGKLLNKNTFRTMAEYSLPLEMLKTLKDSDAALRELYTSLDTAGRRALSARMAQSWNGEQLIKEFTQQAYQMEADKLEFMKNLSMVSQYSLDGTEYRITDTDRKVVEKLLAQAQAELAQVQTEEAGTETNPYIEFPTDLEQEPNQSAWGLVGPARFNSDPELVRLFGNKGSTNARKMIKSLRARIHEGGRTPELIEFETRLLNTLQGIIDPDMEIRLIKPTSAPIEGIENLQQAGAFYHPDGWIGVKSPDFMDSMLTTEILLHELIHAGTSSVLRAVESGQEKSPAAIQAHKRLQELLTKTQAFIEKENLEFFKGKIANVDELIAWGLSNADFQDQVLSKLQLNTEAQNELKTQVKESGFLSFIKSLAGLIFKNRNSQAWTTGLGSLIANSAIVMKHAETSGIKRQRSGNAAILPMSLGTPSAFSLSPQEVFDALGQGNKPLDLGRANYLKDILTNITDAVFQDGAFKERLKRETPFTAEDVFAENIANGEPSFDANSVANLMNLNPQEHYVLESLELAMRETLGLKGPKATSIRREVRQLYNATKALGPEIMYDGDFSNLSQDQQDYYRSLFDAIFKIDKDADGNMTPFLSKFMAAVAVYPPLTSALRKQYLKRGEVELQGKNFFQRIQHLMQLGWSLLMRRFAGLRSDESYTQAAEKLIRNMTLLEKKSQRRIEKARKRGETGLEARSQQLAEKVREGVRNIAKKDVFQNSKREFIQAGSKITQLAMDGRVGLLMDQIKRVRDGNSDEKVGFIGQTWTELRGDDDILARLTQLLASTKTMEQKRKRFNLEVGKEILAAFEGKLSAQESEALTKILVRTGAHILMDNHSIPKILELVESQSKRQDRISALVAQLPAEDRSFYEKQAKALGIHMATGHVKTPILMRNAYNIANKLGTAQKYTVSADTAAAVEPIIAEIATLTAIDRQGAPSGSPKDFRQLAAGVMTRELGRNTDGADLNGVEFLLRAHKQMEVEAHKSLFGSDKTQIVQGYTKDTYDPYVDVIVAREADWDTLEAAGYTKVTHELLKDPADPRGEGYALFTARNGGLGQGVTAIFSNTDNHRQGTNIDDSLRGNRRYARPSVLDRIARNKAPQIQAMLAGQEVSGDESSLVPVLDTQGNIISWRYMMTEVTRDKVLKRDNSLDTVMGNIASSIVDKTQTPLINKNAVDALRNIYEEDFVENSESFIQFGPNSQDPEVQERYRLLPESTKEYIREVWGSDTMIIRNDAYNILFGYRKRSIGDVLDIPPGQRNILHKMLAGLLGEYELQDENGEIVQRVTGKRGRAIVNTGRASQEMVKIVKDTLVIKSLFTLMGNESSNFSILVLHGVPISEIVKSKVVAYASTKEYIVHRQRREYLERLVGKGHLKGKDLATAHQEILELTSTMEANPVAELMNQGMYQTLVEDVAQEEDPYSYTSKVKGTVDQYTQWVPKFVKTATKTMLLTHDTGAYKFLNDLTVMSDFTSRYVLNEHLKNRVNNKMSDEDRIRRVRDAFVDYDVPTSKGMQYLNDMGLVWFSKYYMRSQHVILQMVRENPLRALQIWAIADWMYSLPDILDSTWVSKDLGNLVGKGAFEILDAPRELYTVHMADKIF